MVLQLSGVERVGVEVICKGGLQRGVLIQPVVYTHCDVRGRLDWTPLEDTSFALTLLLLTLLLTAYSPAYMVPLYYYMVQEHGIRSTLYS